MTHNCSKCEYSTNNRSNYNKHVKTIKHVSQFNDISQSTIASSTVSNNDIDQMSYKTTTEYYENEIEKLQNVANEQRRIIRQMRKQTELSNEDPMQEQNKFNIMEYRKYVIFGAMTMLLLSKQLINNLLIPKFRNFNMIQKEQQPIMSNQKNIVENNQ